MHAEGEALDAGSSWKKWKPGIWGRTKDFLMSPYFKACAQLATGELRNKAMLRNIISYEFISFPVACCDPLVLHDCWVLCCAGQFIISLFVFVNKLTFTLSCLASIFFYIGMCPPIMPTCDAHVAHAPKCTCKRLFVDCGGLLQHL